MVTTGNALARWRGTTYARVLSARDFRLLWTGQVVSNLGTYAYSLAVATALTRSMSGSDLGRTAAIVLGVQAGIGAVVGLVIAGPIADRFERRRVMIVSDIVRGLAVASLLFGSAPLWHVVLVAAVLGGASALFEPSLAASLPSVVGADDLVSANAVVGGTFYAAVMIGPAIGALAVAVAGVDGAFLLNALSFGASAYLIARTSRSAGGGAREGHVTPGLLVRDLVDGMRHLRQSRLAVGIMTVMCLVVGVAGVQATVQVVFVREILVPGVGDHAARAAVLALLTTAWGAGMLIGCFVTPPLIRYLPRERLIPLVVAVAGACVLYGSRSSNAASLAALWAAAGAMCGITNVSYESLLQERTVDAFRGRVIATIEAAQEGAYFIGVAAAAVFVALPAARSMEAVGIAFTITGVVAVFILRPPKAAAPDEPAEPATAPLPTFLPGLGSWPEWLSLDAPWEITRAGEVVTVEARWPLVPSDLPRLAAALDQALVTGVTAVALPVRLPPGSTMGQEALEELWAAALERGLIVHRSDDRAPAA